jgi:hypothetical protein
MTPLLNFSEMSDAEAEMFVEARVATRRDRLEWLRGAASAELPLRRDGLVDA